MATPFGTLYEAIRVASGNEDPVIGPEVMPDSRCDVLIRTAIPVLSGYSGNFEHCGYRQNSETFVWEIFNSLLPEAELKAVTITAIATVCAHRYFVGIGNRTAVHDTFCQISNLALVAGGEPILGYKAIGVVAEQFQVL